MEVVNPPRWSNIVMQQPKQPQSKPQLQELNDVVPVGSCKSSKGIAVAVVDANALIHGGESLSHSADRFVSVAEVLSEVRDPSSRHALNFLPFTVETLEPSPEALRKVVSFAKATGDLQTLSDVDMKLIALTYTLEAQIHGTQRLRDTPPPIHMINVKRLPEKDLPGWGSNVPNAEEWEALEHALNEDTNSSSRILPLKDLSLGVDLENRDGTEIVSGRDISDLHVGSQDDDDSGAKRSGRHEPQKREVKIEGKKMVAAGVDASQGAADGDTDDWRPAVSRSTRRRYLRRKARREMSEGLSESGNQLSSDNNDVNDSVNDDQCPELLDDESYDEVTNSILSDGKINNGDKDDELCASIDGIKLSDECDMPSKDTTSRTHSEGLESDTLMSKDPSFNIIQEEYHELAADQDLGNTDITSQTNENVCSPHADELSSEQSWSLRPLSESSVACVTSDYAMQNVLLQMGLRLLAPGGMQIRELHRWVLKCHACFKVTTDTAKIFCPSCGNGGTLRKVAVTVGENGITLAARRPRISLRGTKYSLPLPQGGRDAITKNPILREDQLPKKFLYPKTKKKNNKQEDDDFCVPDDVFLHHNGSRKAPLEPPVRKALAVFSGRRNPNDNHYAAAKH